MSNSRLALNTFTIDLWPSRNCPTSGGAEARSSPPARKGRSEAEWLDGAEERRTISPRDGRIRTTAMLSARTNATNGTRRLEDRQEVDGAMPSQAWIRCECAFTYMNAVFRKNLTDTFSVDATAVDTAFGTGRRSRRWHDRARLCRTTVTYIWGVSDPRNWARERRSGGGRGGRSRPDASSLAACDCARETRAAKSAARRRRTEPFMAKNISDPTVLRSGSSSLLPSPPISTPIGELLPSLLSPSVLDAEVSVNGYQGTETARVHSSR